MVTTSKWLIRFVQSAPLVGMLFWLAWLPAPAQEAGLLQKAGTLFHQGDYAHAEKQYQKAVKVNPSDPYAYLGLSMAQKAQGDLSGAQETLTKLLTLYPTFAPAYYNLGNVLEAKGDLAGARAAYQQYIKASQGNLPSDPEIRIKLRQMGLL